MDWVHGEAHMRSVHGVSVAEANEALADVDAQLFDPDPKSTSGVSARVLGYSRTAQTVLVVILVHREDRPGAWWGANGWRANSADRRIYQQGAAMSTNAKKLVEQVAAEAETTRDEPMPSDATSTRPNKSVPVAIRLAPDDVAAIESLARRLDVPTSTLLRGWILDALTARREESASTALDRLTADVQRLRELIA